MGAKRMIWFIAAFSAVLMILDVLHFATCLLIILAVYLLLDHRTLIDFSLTVRRDGHAAIMLMRQKLMYRFYDGKGMSVAQLWEKTVSKFPRRIALIEADSGKQWTFDEANQFSNAIYNILRKYGAEQGDAVALIMPNCVEYGPFWIGAAKAGCKTALINTSLSGQFLLHSIQISRAKFIISHRDYYNGPLASIMDELSPDVKLMVYDDGGDELHTSKFISLNLELEKANRINPTPDAYNNLSLTDQVLMIYTSGTTGLPKAAKISGYRVHYMGWGPSYLNRWSRGNIFYTP